MTDHLGRVRVIEDGSGNVLEWNDYYPFGARQVRGDYPQLASNRYKYNGKEEQVMGDLEYLDYGARMYDCGVGRWFGVDPLSENYVSCSHYGYCINNPLVLIDPNGKYVTNYVDEDYNLLLRTNDGSEDVVVIPDKSKLEFLFYAASYKKDPSVYDSKGWNNYWKEEFGVAKTLSNDEMFWINQFLTKWSKIRALKYVLNNSASNQFMIGLAHLFSSYISPVGVLMVGTGLSMWPSMAIPKTIPNQYPVRPDTPGTLVPRTLQPGEFIDRFGSPKGFWASPLETSYGARSIPQGLKPYNRYEVIKPIKVQQSLAFPGEMPGQTGYGIQYHFSKPIQHYLDNKSLK